MSTLKVEKRYLGHTIVRCQNPHRKWWF